MDEKLRRFLELPDEAEIAARKAQFDTTFRQIFSASFPVKEPPLLLRAIVECNTWFVAIQAETEQNFAFIHAKAGQYRSALPDEKTKNKRPKGRGGTLLPIHGEQPLQPTIALDGRVLVRALLPEIDGLLLHLPDRVPKELNRAYFAELTALTDAFDLKKG
jgi:hypothetical protein